MQFLHIVVFGVSFVAIAAFKQILGFSYSNSIALYIICMLWPLICIPIYAVSQLTLVFRIHTDRWSIGDTVIFWHSLPRWTSIEIMCRMRFKQFLVFERELFDSIWMVPCINVGTNGNCRDDYSLRRKCDSLSLFNSTSDEDSLLRRPSYALRSWSRVSSVVWSLMTFHQRKAPYTVVVVTER